MGFTIYYITWKPICTNHKRQLDDKNSPSGSARGKVSRMSERGAKNLRISSICHFLTQIQNSFYPLLPACQPACLMPDMKYSWQPWIFICCILLCYYGCDHYYNGTHCRFTVKSSWICSMAISSSSFSPLILHPTHTGRQDTEQNGKTENKREGLQISEG